MTKVSEVSAMKTAMQDSQTASNACFRSGCGQNKAEACLQTQTGLTRQQARKQAKLNRFRLYGRIPKESKLIKVYCAAVYAAMKKEPTVYFQIVENCNKSIQNQKVPLEFFENLSQIKTGCNRQEEADRTSQEKIGSDFDSDDLLQSNLQRQKDLKESWERSYEKYNKTADFGKKAETKQ